MSDIERLVERLRGIWPDLTDDELVVRLAGLVMYLKKWEATAPDIVIATRLSDATLHLREEAGTDEPADE